MRMVGYEIVDVEKSPVSEIIDHAEPSDGSHLAVFLEIRESVPTDLLAPHGSEELCFSNMGVKLTHNGTAARDLGIGLGNTDHVHRRNRSQVLLRPNDRR